MKKERQVAITGMGVISPIGNNVNDFWQALQQGICGIDHLQGFENEELPIRIAAQVKHFNPQDHGINAATARKSDRFALFAQCAAHQAVTDSRLEVAPHRLGVYVGSGIGGMTTFFNESAKVVAEGAKRVSPLFIPMMISNIAAGNIAIAHNAQGPCLPVVTACATATHAIGEAYRAIKHGYADAIIAGGTEAAIHPLSIGGFANSKALSRSDNPHEASLPFDSRRTGFVMAEGSGVVVLEALEHAQHRGATIHALLCGYGNTCDAYHYTAPRPDGTAAAAAMQQALEEGGYNARNTLYINAHGTGTPLNDAAETQAIKLAITQILGNNAQQMLYPDHATQRSLYISSTKSMTGHALGAAGGLELIASVLALKHGIVPPTIHLTHPDPACDLFYTPNNAINAPIDMALSNSLGFGGHNGCLTLKKW